MTRRRWGRCAPGQGVGRQTADTGLDITNSEAPMAIAAADREQTGDLASGLAGEVIARLDRIERALVARVDRDHFSTHQAAARLSLSEWTVRQACNTGRIKGEQPNGRSWRIPLAEVEQMELRGGLGPASCESSCHRVAALLGKEVPVTPPHLLRSMVHQFVHHPLAHLGTGEVRREAVSQGYGSPEAPPTCSHG